MFVNFKEAEGYIENLPTFTPEGVKKGKLTYDLDGIGELLRRVGNPERRLKVIHIAGTNGKGSVGTYIRNIITAGGYRAGHFSSPELIRFDEQISIDGKIINEEETSRILGQLKTIAEEMVADNLAYPSKFELILATALIYFKDENCDFVVLECGLGGTNDATNIIETPELAVITKIGIDHTSILGKSLSEIAGHKAGIIKRDGRVVSAPQDVAVREVLEARAAEVSAELIFAAGDPNVTERSLGGQTFTLEGFEGSIKTRMLGTYQVGNAVLALRAATLLREKSADKISEESIKKGIYNASYPCRFELISKEPYIVVDGAHNEDGARSFVESLSAYFPGRKTLMIAGVLADKNYKKMLQILAPLSEGIYAVEPGSVRALPGEKLAEAAKECGIAAEPCEDYSAAVRKAMDEAGKDGLICVLGSLYCAGRIRELMIQERGRDIG